MQLPKVSIVIPTYNQSAMIKCAIDSALMQDYPNLEVIVSDDSSDNETEKLAAQYSSDARFRFYRNHPAAGKAANYRKLLYEHATGKWVVNLDGDDYYTDKNFISEAVKSIYSNGGNDVLFYMASQVMAYSYRDQVLQPRLQAEETVMKAEDYVYNIYSFLHFCHLGTLYNAAKAKQSGFYEREIISSDLYSFFKLCFTNPRNNVILSKKIVGKWVQHGANESRDYNFRKHLKNFKLYWDVYKAAQKNKAGDASKKAGWFVKSLFLYWGSYTKRLLVKRK